MNLTPSAAKNETSLCNLYMHISSENIWKEKHTSQLVSDKKEIKNFVLNKENYNFRNFTFFY